METPGTSRDRSYAFWCDGNCWLQESTRLASLQRSDIAGRAGCCSSSKWWRSRWTEERLAAPDRFGCDCDRARRGGTTVNLRIAPSRGGRRRESREREREHL